MYLLDNQIDIKIWHFSWLFHRPLSVNGGRVIVKDGNTYGFYNFQIATAVAFFKIKKKNLK